jgi:hypothetical protein
MNTTHNNIFYFAFAFSTSVAYAIGPSVTTSRAQLIFPSKPKFCNFFEFSKTNPFEKKYLPYLCFENCETNSIKSNSSQAFQQHQECPQIPIQLLIFNLFNFH